MKALADLRRRQCLLLCAATPLPDEDFGYDPVTLKDLLDTGYMRYPRWKQMSRCIGFAQPLHKVKATRDADTEADDRGIYSGSVSDCAGKHQALLLAVGCCGKIRGGRRYPLTPIVSLCLSSD